MLTALAAAAAGVDSGSGKPKTEKVGKVTRAQVEVRPPALLSSSCECKRFRVGCKPQNMGMYIMPNLDAASIS
jgi:ribosomal protein L11